LNFELKARTQELNQIWLNIIL